MHSHMSVVFKLVVILKYLPNSFWVVAEFQLIYTHACDIELNYLSFFFHKRHNLALSKPFEIEIMMMIPQLHFILWYCIDFQMDNTCIFVMV